MKILLISLFCCCFAIISNAQIGEIPELIDNSRPQKREKNPTVITSKTLTVDANKNTAEFIGNVIADDDDVVMHCDKMVIYIETLPDTAIKKDSKKPAAKKDQKDPLSDLSGGGKRQVNRIECIGNVLIIRKMTGLDGKPSDDQRSISDKAIYYVPQEKFVLTGEKRPIVHSGKETLSGTQIRLYRDTGKIEVDDVRVEMQRSPDAAAPGKPKAETKPVYRTNY